ncbi:MAG: dihydroorotate dehydrogenase [Pseudomonadota bacterium]
MRTESSFSVTLGRLRLANPVMTASGTFGYGQEYEAYTDVNRLGAIVVKGISLEPRAGNPPPRAVETPAGMLNAIGLENVGLERFLAEKLPYLRTLNTKVVVNILGGRVKDYARLASELSQAEGVAAVEVNVSCPNVASGGLAFGLSVSSVYELTKTVRRAVGDGFPVIVKLSPEAPDLPSVCAALEDAGADAASLINTIRGMAFDINTGKPRLSTGIGGLSGPAIRPIAVRMVYECAQKTRLPLIGIGGIVSAADAAEFILAGASAVQVGTANLVNPNAAVEVLEGLTKWLRARRAPQESI